MRDGRIGYNIDEAARDTGVNPRTLEAYCKAGKLKAKKIGKRWIIDAKALVQFITGEPDGQRVQEA